MKKIIFSLYLLTSLVLVSCSEDNSDELTVDVSLANKQVTGSSANDLLSDQTYKSMNIELVYVEGYAPTQTTINNLKSFLQSRVYKPSGISINSRSIPSPGDNSLTIDEIVDFEDTNRTKFNTVDQVAVWVFFTDGASSKDTENSKILGTAYRNTSIIIYEKTLQEFSNNHLGPDKSVLETTIFEHEFCHLFGLTNLGTAMITDHEDEEHEKHCDVEDCLMYWSAEAGLNIGNLSGSAVPQLDSQCIADLQGNGGK